MLKTMSIPVWTARKVIPGQKMAEDIFLAPEISEVGSSGDSSIDAINASIGRWNLLQENVLNCTACELHQSRKNPVFGVGNRQADLMIVGEAPGVDEDIQGEPFIGPSGQLLNKMIFSLGFSREDVYIANIVKCAPSGGRKPKTGETEACSAFLIRQIELVQPKVILAVGATSAKKLLGCDDRISDIRGQVRIHEQSSIPILATFHPAYLLRKPTEKRTVWGDLLLVKKIIAEGV